MSCLNSVKKKSDVINITFFCFRGLLEGNRLTSRGSKLISKKLNVGIGKDFLLKMWHKTTLINT